MKTDKEAGPTQQDQRGDEIEDVDRLNGHANCNQQYHEPGVLSIGIFEQVIQGQDQKEEEELTGYIAHNAKAVGQGGLADPAGGSGGIVGDDQRGPEGTCS